MSSNKKIKDRLIELYGPECFIDKLHLRKDKKPCRYRSKGQYERMKQLTYHHIKEKRNGGKTTIENGALLSAENHEWFNKQSDKAQRQMNELFQEYKRLVDIGIIVNGQTLVEKSIEIDMSNFIEIPVIETTEEIRKKYNRAEEKRKWKKEIEEEDYER